MFKVESEKLKIYIKIINFLMLSLHGRIWIGIPKKYYTIVNART